MEQAISLLSEMADQFENAPSSQPDNQNGDTETKEPEVQSDDDETFRELMEITNSEITAQSNSQRTSGRRMFYSPSVPRASQSKEEKLYFKFIASIIRKHEELFDELLDQIEDINVNPSGTGKRWPPIMHAVHKNRIGFVKKLIARGANLNVTDLNDGRSLLHKAVASGQNKMVHLLLLHGLDVNAVDHEGQSPLWTCCKKGFADIVSILLENKQICNINLRRESDNARESGGQTALFICADKGFVRPAQLLLDYDKMQCDVNIPDSHNRTPLLRACTKGHEEMVRLLLKYDPDINVLNYVQRSALTAAYRIGKRNICNILMDHNGNFGREFELWRLDVDGKYILEHKHHKIDSSLKERIEQQLHVYLVNTCRKVLDSERVPEPILVMIAQWTY